jgi:hypothetical protein
VYLCIIINKSLKKKKRKEENGVGGAYTELRGSRLFLAM